MISMGDMELDYEKIESVISDLTNKLENDKEEISSAYSRLEAVFEQSSGEEAEALRGLQKAERRLMTEVQETLKKLGESIEYAAGQFRGLDASTAKLMGGEKRGPDI